MFHTVVIVVVIASVRIGWSLTCTDRTCFISPGSRSFAEQVHEVAVHHDNRNFTVIVHQGIYNSTNGSRVNFINFHNVTITKHINEGFAVIMCPATAHNFSTINGIGIETSVGIVISGLNFTNCGPVSSGLYILKCVNVFITNSSFHHNTDNGLQILFGNNITITHCNFFSNVGTQPDRLSDLINSDLRRNRGTALGLFLRNQGNVQVTIEGCTFNNNIAYKTESYNPVDETRPYGYIPFGNGGGMYIQLINVQNSYISISNCNFTNNKAINQGGALVLLPVNSDNNNLDIAHCRFVGNRVLGYSLSSQKDTVDRLNVDDFINRINTYFSTNDSDVKSLGNLSFSELRSTGGSGGAISVSLFDAVEYNKLCVSDTYFINNTAFAAGSISFVVNGLLSNIKDGVDSNQAFIDNCTFAQNFALYGAAIGVVSYSRVDVGSLPISIKNSKFLNNSNLRGSIPSIFSKHFGILGSVLGLRFPVSFKGRNIFQSNIGGGVNMNHARVTIQGVMELSDHSGATLGGAVRLGELTLMHLLPGAKLMFTNNTATQAGGAIAIENFRGGNHTTRILNNNCFIQYNIGDEYEHRPSRWNASFIFDGNNVTSSNGQGKGFFADDISQCILGKRVAKVNASEVFGLSIFSQSSVFDFSKNKDKSNKPHFETDPRILIVEKDILSASLGENFLFKIYAEDQNGNKQDGVYSYPASPTLIPSNILRIHLDTDNVVTSAFGVVRNVTAQRATLVLHYSTQIQSCRINYNNSQSFSSKFSLNLTDSSRGVVVSVTVVTVNLQCCHVEYVYDSTTGECIFMNNRSNNDIILGPERISNKYIYVRPDYYGGFDPANGYFVTARIPPPYHVCAYIRLGERDGRLPGCVVMDDDPDQQCNQGRTGFLCGKCSRDINHGSALNLAECVPCDPWDIVVFVLICIIIIVVSMAIIHYNIGLPNALKGFLFFIQVSGYVYRANSGLQWHFYLSRLFGFSLFFPLCISSSLDTADVAMLGFVPPVLMAMCASIYIFLAKFSQYLSERKTVDGIWFLVLITYVYTADTCLNLLRCVQVYEPIEFKGKRVYYFDGGLECFHKKHLYYGVIAIIVSVLVLIPSMLYVFAISFNLIEKAGPLRDVVSFGIKAKFHWWSGFDLFRRLTFFLVYLIFENFRSEYTQLALTLTALLILVITSRVCPYTKQWVNFVECLILLDLVLITAYFLNNDQLLSTSNNDPAIILLVLPFIYFLTYMTVKIAMLCWKRLLHVSDEYYGSGSLSDLLLSCWSALLHKKKANQPTDPLVVNEDLVYSQFRDELDEFVTVKD